LNVAAADTAGVGDTAGSGAGGCWCGPSCAAALGLTDTRSAHVNAEETIHFRRITPFPNSSGPRAGRWTLR